MINKILMLLVLVVLIVVCVYVVGIIIGCVIMAIEAITKKPPMIDETGEKCPEGHPVSSVSGYNYENGKYFYVTGVYCRECDRHKITSRVEVPEEVYFRDNIQTHNN